MATISTDLLPYKVRLKLYSPIIEKAFKAKGLPPQWGLAFCYVESTFRKNLINDGPGDKKRGNAWGLFQITYKTAVEDIGYDAAPEGLLNPHINTAYAAKFIAHLSNSYGGRLHDVGAAYNGGRRYVHAPESTRKVYVPKLLAAAKMFGWNDPIPIDLRPA
jgi:soluble lytic murein transglycosylase-like protein